MKILKSPPSSTAPSCAPRRVSRALWRDQGKRAETRDLLAPVYAWFTECFDTRNMQDAKALLEELR